MRDQITAGFLPLLDSAILITAKERGFAEEEGIDLLLVKETSWANVRDRIAVGHFDVAHMLAPMPIAANLGLSPIPMQLAAPMALGFGGNAISVSNALWAAMAEFGAGGLDNPAAAGRALRLAIGKRRAAGGSNLRFAVVHPHSGHNFELRYWLAASGIDPERDVDIAILPPPLMPDAIAAGRIDGFCVGEPWSSVAVAAGKAHIVAVKAAIWRQSPEKVLGVGAEWAEGHADLLQRLLRALYRSAVWCGLAKNRAALADMLASDAYLAQPARLIFGVLAGALETGHGVETVSDFFVPADGAATFPRQAHALWLYAQMVRWGQLDHSVANAEKARLSFRPDLYRSAIGPLGISIPDEDGSTQAGPLFDGAEFDPADLEGYIARQRGAHNRSE